MPGRSRFSMAQGFCTVCDVTGQGLFQKLQLHIPLSFFFFLYHYWKPFIPIIGGRLLPGNFSETSDSLFFSGLGCSGVMGGFSPKCFSLNYSCEMMHE